MRGHEFELHCYIDFPQFIKVTCKPKGGCLRFVCNLSASLDAGMRLHMRHIMSLNPKKYKRAQS